MSTEPVPDPAASSSRAALHDLVRTLRERCPWDREQTHRSLTPYLIEEAYEVVDAINDSDDDALVEELGDLLFQVEIHCAVRVEQAGRFSIAEVATGIHDKLVRRHPHLFGEATATDANDVAATWEAVKRNEKPERTSPFGGIPRALPALTLADATQRRAARAGFDYDDIGVPAEKVTEELQEVLAASGPASVFEEVGDLLFAAVVVARHAGVDPESSLRAATRKFRRRFAIVDDLANEQGTPLDTLDADGLTKLWSAAKRHMAAAETSR